MNDDEAIRKLKEADEALAVGDVATARELASDVDRAFMRYIGDPNQEALHLRATRIRALSYVRDPAATPADLEHAVAVFERWVDTRESAPALTPDYLADYAETLERNGQNDRAYETLLPVVEKDLVGSAYANAAFARAARVRGDHAHSELAMKRCETMAASPAMCRAEYPKPPLLRGHARDYAILGGLFLVVALLRLRRRNDPWSRFHAPLYAGLVAALGVAAFVLTNIRWPVAGIAFAAPLLFFGLAQRASWLAAVRRGHVAGYTLRVATEDDVAPRTLRLILGPRAPELVEAAIDPAYRDSARPPALFRLEQSALKFGYALAFILFGVATLGCALVLMTLSRGF